MIYCPDGYGDSDLAGVISIADLTPEQKNAHDMDDGLGEDCSSQRISESLPFSLMKFS